MCDLITIRLGGTIPLAHAETILAPLNTILNDELDVAELVKTSKGTSPAEIDADVDDTWVGDADTSERTPALHAMLAAIDGRLILEHTECPNGPDYRLYMDAHRVVNLSISGGSSVIDVDAVAKAAQQGIQAVNALIAECTPPFTQVPPLVFTGEEQPQRVRVIGDLLEAFAVDIAAPANMATDSEAFKELVASALPHRGLRLGREHDIRLDAIEAVPDAEPREA
jgi:hypothetical protein